MPPAPKRSDQRRRTNSKPAAKIATPGRVRKPAAAKHWHPVALRWYRDLSKSGQAKFYEPSDWATAHYTAEIMTRMLAEEKLNAASVNAITSLMNTLLTTEGARRRVQIEIEREKAPDLSDREANEIDNVIGIAFAQA